MTRTNGMDIDAMIARHRDGFSMEKPFYLDPGVFEADVERVIMPIWHLVDHASRIPNAGDYFLFELAGESIIVVRGWEGEIRAFYNVCRHRGSIICREAHGNVRLLRCPYHAWSYDLDGSLKVAQLMHEGFDLKDYGLHPCHIGVSYGLIFVNLSPQPGIDFDTFIDPFTPYFELHGLANAKIAHRASYPTEANWKLVLENFFECYHCMPAHPEYCQVHAKDYILAYGGGNGSGPEEAEVVFQPQLDAFNEKCKSLGHLYGSFVETDDNSPHMRSAARTPFKDGWLSETRDGQPAAPLMGTFKDWDGGYSATAFSPFATIFMPNDFASIFRFIPVNEDHTDVELIWLVRAEAEEGRDYDLEKIIWLWDVTTIADKTIIEGNKQGILSRRYEPGPYSRHEKGTNYLINWYLNRLRAGA